MTKEWGESNAWAAVIGSGMSSSDFSDSVRLGEKLDLIKSICLDDVIAKCSFAQNAKIRVDLILKRLLVTMLCFPAVSSMFGVGTNSSLVFASLGNAISFLKEGTGTDDRKEGEYGSGNGRGDAQVNNPLVLSLLQALEFTASAEVALMETGTDASLDDLRASLLCDLVRVRSSSLIPILLTVEDHYDFCLSVLSCHLLCVRALSDDISSAVKANTLKVLAELGEAVGDSRGGLDLDRALSMVRAAAGHFFGWLREHEDGLTRQCRSAEIIASVNPSVRAWLKAEEYSSPQEIVWMYQRKYRTHLKSIQLPLQTFTQVDVKQAVKDVERETMVVNGTSTKGGRFVGEGLQAVICSCVLEGRPHESNSEEQEQLQELLRSYILLAASRTIAGGDYFCVVEDLFAGDGTVLCSSQGSASLSVVAEVDKIAITVREGFGLFVADNIGDVPLINFSCVATTAIKVPQGAADLLARPDEFIAREIAVEPHCQ